VDGEQPHSAGEQRAELSQTGIIGHHYRGRAGRGYTDGVEQPRDHHGAEGELGCHLVVQRVGDRAFAHPAGQDPRGVLDHRPEHILQSIPSEQAQAHRLFSSGNADRMETPTHPCQVEHRKPNRKIPQPPVQVAGEEPLESAGGVGATGRGGEGVGIHQIRTGGHRDRRRLQAIEDYFLVYPPGGARVHRILDDGCQLARLLRRTEQRRRVDDLETAYSFAQAAPRRIIVAEAALVLLVSSHDEEVHSVVFPEHQRHVTGLRATPDEAGAHLDGGHLASSPTDQDEAGIEFSRAGQHLERMIVTAGVDQRRFPAGIEGSPEASEELIIGGRVEILDQCAGLFQHVGHTQCVITGDDRPVGTRGVVGVMCHQDHFAIPGAIQGLAKTGEELVPQLGRSFLEKPVSIEEGNAHIASKVPEHRSGIPARREERDLESGLPGGLELHFLVANALKAGVSRGVAPIMVTGDEQAQAGLVSRLASSHQVHLAPEPG
jgi:hypothetical protein